MTDRIISAMLLLIAIIHLLPVVGLLGAERITALYSVDLSNRNLEILMRHRAALFGILGVLFAHAAFAPSARPIAFAVAFASIVSFFVVSYAVGGFNDAIRRVVIADVVALVALLIAVPLHFKGIGK